MNYIDVFQKCLVYACLAGAAVCLAVVLAYRFRGQLRKLHERWLGLGPLGRVVSILAVSIAVLYGGTKSTTNDPPDTVGGGSTNPPPMMCCSPRPRLSAPPQQTEPDVLSTATPTNYTSLLAWHRRGAYSDWQRIDFPDGFAFPHGTNLLTSVTLFAWGEIREEVKVRGEGEQRICDHICSPSPSIFTFPAPLSLEPGASSVTYGLTPSNSFLIAWQNACVNRDATNRIDASIELFRNGAMATTVIPLSASTPPTYTYIPTPLPEGFVGEGQDTNWIASALSPQDASLVAEKGYDDWLLDDYVGINEQNGRYMVSVTVHSLPDDGTPCYLVCGPYKVVVKQAGTYSFPLEVFTEYRARTYPIRLPLSIFYDDGYRSDDENEMSPLMNTTSLLGAAPVPDYYLICMTPHVYVVPSHIPLEQAVNARIALWCNVPSGRWSYHGSLLNDLELNFGIPSYAEIRTAAVAQRVVLLMHYAGHECEGVFYIDPPPGYSWPTNSWYY